MWRLRSNDLVQDILVVSTLALVLGLIRLGAPSLWYDEAYTYRQLQRSAAAQIEGYMPPYYWLLEPWTSVAGTSEWALRFPSVVAAMAACSLLVLLARKLFDRRIALVSGLLLATSPFFVKWSQQARAYTLIVVACLLATILLVRALERGSRSAWAAYGIAFAAVLVLHAAAGLFLIPAHVVLATQRRQRALPHGLLAAVIVVAIGVSWVAQLAMRTRSEQSETAWIPFPSGETVVRALMDVSGIAGLGVLFALVGIWKLQANGARDAAVWLGTWAFAPFVVALVISIARPIFLDRYLIVAAPAFSMLAAVAIVSLASRPRAVLASVAGVAAFAGLWLWYTNDESGNWRGEDWRRAVAAVTERAAEADAVVVVPWWAHDAAQYYGARVSDVSSADSIWVLAWSEDGHELPAGVRRPLGFGDHELVERQQFGRRVSAQLWRRG